MQNFRVWSLLVTFSTESRLMYLHIGSERSISKEFFILLIMNDFIASDHQTIFKLVPEKVNLFV